MKNKKIKKTEVKDEAQEFKEKYGFNSSILPFIGAIICLIFIAIALQIFFK